MCMERICPLSPPPPADYARIRWPQQMRQARLDDNIRPCPLRDEIKLLWDYEAPHASMWLLHRGDTVRVRPGLSLLGLEYLRWYMVRRRADKAFMAQLKRFQSEVVHTLLGPE